MSPHRTSALRTLAASLAVAAAAAAQDLEPRRWTHLPVGTNVAGFGYVYTKGDIAFDPVLRIEGADVEQHTAVASYTRYFGLFDKTARVDVVVPYQRAEWTGLLDGAPAAVDREGFGDPTLRLSTHLVGSPALDGKEFAEFQREHQVNTIVGVALETRFPFGEYKDDKLLNIGQNRFVFTPQVGALHTRGPWSFELTGSMSLYTDNDEFFGGTTLEQDPVYALQAHTVRTFDGGYWVAAGLAYGWAGETTIAGDPKEDQRRNLLSGVAFGFRIGDTQGIKLAWVHADARTDNGTDADSLLVMWSMRF